MKQADSITASRIVLAPLFFILFSWGIPVGIPRLIVVVVLWVLFAIIELSDLIDGAVARKTNQVSSFGKLFDPFADVLARLGYFICFMSVGLMPYWVFFIILFREYSMLFMRLLLVQKGVAMGARKGGKLKSFMYAVSGGVSLFIWSLGMLSIDTGINNVFIIGNYVLYCIAALLALVSFIDYFREFRKVNK